MDELRVLLEDLQTFLSKNDQLEGASRLLKQLEIQMEKLQLINCPVNTRKISNMSEESMEGLINEEELEMKLKSLTRVESRKFANLLDMFILEYNFDKDAYEVLPYSEIEKNLEVLNDRRAILELTIGPISQHCIEKEKTSSMTDLHRLTSNIPQSSPILILPNYVNEVEKYTYICEVKECIAKKGKYYLVDRYLCFVADGMVIDGINTLSKQFKSFIFEQRIVNVGDPFEVSCKIITHSLKQTLPILVDKANQFPLELHYPRNFPWAEKQQSFYLNTIRSSIFTSLSVLMVYLSICEYKILLLTTKNQMSRLSDLALTLEYSLKPLKYTYPIVFCSLNKEHCDFIESPVPLTIGFWGSTKRKEKFIKQLPDYFFEESVTSRQVPTLVLDLENYSISFEKGMTSKDVYVVEKMSKYISRYGKGEFFWMKFSGFLAEIMSGIGQDSIKSEWVTYLQEKIENSQMYLNYAKF